MSVMIQATAKSISGIGRDRGFTLITKHVTDIPFYLDGHLQGPTPPWHPGYTSHWVLGSGQAVEKMTLNQQFNALVIMFLCSCVVLTSQ
jgi:hypothetical protein